MKASTLFQIVTCVAAFGTSAPVSADIVTDWNTAALNAIRANRTPPPAASRALAMLHISIFDAVNGINRMYEQYAVPSTEPASASKDAAAGAAAHAILVALFPLNASYFDDLYAVTLAAVPEGPKKAHGEAWGASVANQILALRVGDGSDIAISAPTFTGPGFWEPTPPSFAQYLLPQWGFVMPFAMPASDAFRPPGPPDLGSHRYLEDLAEVRALGAAVGSSRTSEQSLIALFWADGAGTETPPGHWNRIARDVAGTFGNTIDENARLFALLNIAMADAAICAWDAKYTYDFWRPVTAIRETSDPTWMSFLVTPPFPDYVSGHSAFSGAASTVLGRFYGTDNLAFTTGSDALPGVVRGFPSFSAAAAEAAVSRLYGGIHFRSAIEDGLTAGIAIGEWVFAHNLLQTGNRGRSK